MNAFSRVLILALAGLVGACTVDKTPAPALTGPSEFALRVALQAVPDSILWDGASQAMIRIEAAAPDTTPIRGLPVRIEMAVNGVVQDFGTLSSKTAVTGDDGRATVVYTAPPRPAVSTSELVIVTFLVTPIGNDYRGESPRQVDLRLMPPGIILPPNAAPVAAFTASSSSPKIMEAVVFDASGSTDPDVGGPCAAQCSYHWDFGDGVSASGRIATHTFRYVGTWAVTLTVTDTRGASATAVQAVTVEAGAPPTASFTFSPTQIAPGQRVFFTAASSRGAGNRTIVEFDWDFGDGTFGGGVTTSHVYNIAGSYVVTLVVEDDAGGEGTVTQTITVGTPTGGGTGPTASFTISPPTGPRTTTFSFDASASSPIASITQFVWDFGDSSAPRTTTASATSYQYASAGTYTVTLAVRDSQNRTGNTNRSVTVTP